VREVDYASAAALIVRKDVFRRLGGFDARYSPAYYEDTDLCFGIREIGRKVLYCPHAEVVHHEGVTNSTDVLTGVKRYQPVNKEKFAAKWEARLREQPKAVSDRRQVRAVADRRTRHGGKNLMFTAVELPQWDRQNGALDMDSFCRLAVQAGHHVTFVAHNTTLRDKIDLNPYVRRMQRMGIMVGRLERRWKDVYTHVQAMEILLADRDYAAALMWAASEAPFFLDVIQRVSPSTRTIVNAGDVAFVREARRLMLAARDRLSNRDLASVVAPE
jgi:hypothetical protein